MAFFRIGLDCGIRRIYDDLGGGVGKVVWLYVLGQTGDLAIKLLLSYCAFQWLCNQPMTFPANGSDARRGSELLVQRLDNNFY